MIQTNFLMKLGQERFFIYSLFTVFLESGDYRRFYLYALVCREWYLISKDVLLTHLRKVLPNCVSKCSILLNIPNEFTAYPVNINSHYAIERLHYPDKVVPTNDLAVYWIHYISGDNTITLIRLGYYDKKMAPNKCKNMGYVSVSPRDIVSCLTGNRLIQ